MGPDRRKDISIKHEEDLETCCVKGKHKRVTESMLGVEESFLCKWDLSVALWMNISHYQLLEQGMEKGTKSIQGRGNMDKNTEARKSVENLKELES